MDDAGERYRSDGGEVLSSSDLVAAQSFLGRPLPRRARSPFGGVGSLSETAGLPAPALGRSAGLRPADER